MEPVNLHWADISCIVLYFVLVIAVGIYSMCKANRGTVSGYFLAGRYMIWLPVGASIFASNIGSEHFIGLSGSGAAAGIGVGCFELNALIILQLLGWVFLPVYIASKASTLPEFMKKRFGGRRIQVYLACLSMLLYIFTKVSVNMFSGALFVQFTLGWNLYLSILLLLVMTAICTVTGGLIAVLYTDTLQLFVMLGGAITLAIFSFVKVGGIKGLAEKYSSAIPNDTLNDSDCGYPRKDAWVLLRGVDSDLPWPGFAFGQTTASIWYWCADQMMVQRVMAAKSLSHAKGGTIFAGYLKILPLFIIIMPGMISRVLFTDEIACVTHEKCLKYCGNSMGCSNLAYPMLVVKLLPVGLRGVMLAVMFAALMSDLSSIFNSASTLFTIDIWKTFRSHSTNRELVIVGRLFVLVMVIVSYLWVPVIQTMQGGQLFYYIQAVSAYLAPPVAAVTLLALFWKRYNEKGAFAGLIVGIVIGVTRMILDFIYPEPHCGDIDNRPTILTRIHFIYFAIVLFWSSAIVGIVISLLTEPLPEKMLVHTTYWSRLDPQIPDANDDNGDVENDTTQKHFLKRVTPTEVKKIPQFEPEEKKKTQDVGLLRRFLDWFCGLDSPEEVKVTTTEYKSHLREISSLKQDRWANILLNVNLVIILAVAAFIYGFFSQPTPLFL